VAAEAAVLAQQLAHEAAARRAGEAALGHTQGQLEELIARCVRLTHKETALSAQLRCAPEREAERDRDREAALGHTQGQLEELIARCVRLTHKETALSAQLRCAPEREAERGRENHRMLHVTKRVVSRHQLSRRPCFLETAALSTSRLARGRIQR
jgi:hypothetical protein